MSGIVPVNEELRILVNIPDPDTRNALTEWINSRKVSLALADRTDKSKESPATNGWINAGEFTIHASGSGTDPQKVRTECQQELEQGYPNLTSEQRGKIMQILEEQSRSVPNHKLIP